MIDLKKFYDAAVDAGTAKTAKAVEIQKLFDSGETEKGLAMKADLDALTKKSERRRRNVSFYARSGCGRRPCDEICSGR